MISKIKNEISGKPYLNRESLNNCGNINSCIRLDIVEEIPQISDVYLANGYVIGNEGRKHPHMFVYIPADSFSGSESIIVDGAIDQFTKENKQNGNVKCEIGTEEEFKSGIIDSLIVSKISEVGFYKIKNKNVTQAMSR